MWTMLHSYPKRPQNGCSCPEKPGNPEPAHLPFQNLCAHLQITLRSVRCQRHGAVPERRLHSLCTYPRTNAG
jgi:hypothetical protein